MDISSDRILEGFLLATTVSAWWAGVYLLYAQSVRIKHVAKSFREHLKRIGDFVLEEHPEWHKTMGFPKKTASFKAIETRKNEILRKMDGNSHLFGLIREEQDKILACAHTIGNDYAARERAKSKESSTRPKPWREILGVSNDDNDINSVRKAFRKQAMALHPDRLGGDAAKMAALNIAITKAENELSRNQRHIGRGG